MEGQQRQQALGVVTRCEGPHHEVRHEAPQPGVIIAEGCRAAQQPGGLHLYVCRTLKHLCLSRPRLRLCNGNQARPATELHGHTRGAA